MDTVDKLKLLSAAAKYDICAATGCGNTGGSTPRAGVCHSFLPDGRCISLFKVLQTNTCQKDCFYCPNRVQQDVPRTLFTPDELASLFFEFYRRNYVEGLFLSSGISRSPSHTMEQMIKTVEILRLKYQFNGYIHLKILPGARFDYVEKAVQLASRVSINIEAPSPERLRKLSSLKNFEGEIINRMKWISHLNAKGNLPAGQTTQFIVGAAEESDSEILHTSTGLYSQIGMRRVYFSAFQPVIGTPLETVAPTPVLREHRLYQSDFLLRHYDFKCSDIYFDRNGNLPLGIDPKMYHAINNLDLYPVEISQASLHDLLRVPGIGPTSARRIIRARRSFRLNSLEELKNIGVVIKKAAPFIQVNGKFRDSYKLVKQLELWSDANDYPTQLNPIFNA